jgi:hypothetical protein
MERAAESPIREIARLDIEPDGDLFEGNAGIEV